MTKVINLLKAEATADEEKRIKYYTNDNKQRMDSLNDSFSANQINKRKLDKLPGLWIFITGILFTISYSLFTKPQDIKCLIFGIITILMILLAAAIYTYLVFLERKILNTQMSKI